MNDVRLQPGARGSVELVIPARNESGRLPSTLHALTAHVSRPGSMLAGRVEVLVVDNASTDGTAAAAADAATPALPVRVVSCAEVGKGAAVRAGMACTVAETVAFMDADGATGLDALERGLGLLASGADAVVGSRSHPGSVISARQDPLRSLGAAMFRGAARHLVPGIDDTQCGFKLMRGDLARAAIAEVRAAGFSFDVELLARLRLAGAHLVELPVTWVDVPGSTFHPARHGAAAFWELARISRRLRAQADGPGERRADARPMVLQPQQYLAPLHI